MIVPLILYLNLENTLIPREMFPKLLSSGKESYLTAIHTMDSRVCLVAPSKDWLMLKIANPKIIDTINKHSVVIMPTLFSHVLPDLFPETLAMQYTLSTSILKDIFETISWNGIIPENTASSNIVPFALDHWKSVVLSVGHNNLRGLETGHYDLEGNNGTSIPLNVIANASSRLKYMKMYREETEANEVIDDMIGDDITKTCLFDFERPWSNIVYFPHCKKSAARLDIWKRFHKRLSREHLYQWETKEITKRRSIYLNKANLEMWENKESQWLIDIQREIMQSNTGRGDYFEFASMIAESSMPPRVLTRFMQDDSFPSSYNGSRGVVDLVGDVSKVKEMLFICKNIQQKRRVDYGAEFLARGERLYLNLLHKVLAHIDKKNS